MLLIRLLILIYLLILDIILINRLFKEFNLLLYIVY